MCAAISGLWGYWTHIHDCLPVFFPSTIALCTAMGVCLGLGMGHMTPVGRTPFSQGTQRQETGAGGGGMLIKLVGGLC
jgi:hypothetical protein